MEVGAPAPDEVRVSVAEETGALAPGEVRVSAAGEAGAPTAGEVGDGVGLSKDGALSGLSGSGATGAATEPSEIRGVAPVSKAGSGRGRSEPCVAAARGALPGGGASELEGVGVPFGTEGALCAGALWDGARGPAAGAALWVGTLSPFLKKPKRPCLRFGSPTDGLALAAVVALLVDGRTGGGCVDVGGGGGRESDDGADTGWLSCGGLGAAEARRHPKSPRPLDGVVGGGRGDRGTSCCKGDLDRVGACAGRAWLGTDAPDARGGIEVEGGARPCSPMGSLTDCDGDEGTDVPPMGEGDSDRCGVFDMSDVGPLARSTLCHDCMSERGSGCDAVCGKSIMDCMGDEDAAGPYTPASRSISWLFENAGPRKELPMANVSLSTDFANTG